MRIVIRQADGIILFTSGEVPAEKIGGVLEVFTAPFMFGDSEWFIEVTALPLKEIAPTFRCA